MDASSDPLLGKDRGFWSPSLGMGGTTIGNYLWVDVGLDRWQQGRQLTFPEGAFRSSSPSVDSSVKGDEPPETSSNSIFASLGTNPCALKARSVRFQ